MKKLTAEQLAARRIAHNVREANARHEAKLREPERKVVILPPQPNKYGFVYHIFSHEE
jgi:hypothetical protein